MPELVRDPLTSEIVDAETGVVYEDAPLDIGPEWRSFTEEERVSRSRVGAAVTPLLHDYGVSTTSRSRKLRAIMQRVRESGRTIEIHALSTLYRIASELGIPRYAAETAAMLLRRIMPRSKKHAEMAAAAALYAAVRVHGLPYTAKEIASEAGFTVDEISRYMVKASSFIKTGDTETIVKLAYKYALKITGDNKVAMLASQIARYARRICTHYFSTTTLAAASVYIASLVAYPARRISMEKIARIVGTSEPSVRNAYREMLRNLCIEVVIE